MCSSRRGYCFDKKRLESSSNVNDIEMIIMLKTMYNMLKRFWRGFLARSKSKKLLTKIAPESEGVVNHVPSNNAC